MSAKSIFRPLSVIATACAVLSGCGAPNVYRDPRIDGIPHAAPAERFAPGNATHNYTVQVVDIAGKPVNGATVEWKIEANGQPLTQSGLTGNEGINSLAVTVPPKFMRATESADYTSVVRYTVKRDGFYPVSGTMSETSYLSSTSKRPPAPQSAHVRLLQPADYLSTELAESKRYAQLRSKVLDFLELIRLESILNKSELELHGIGMQEFKGKRYLSVKLASENVFNSLKLNRYEIGRQVFDDTVRKILNPLNEKISDPKSFYGYNIIVETGMKSFTDENAVRESLKYEFMMPQSAVRSYKDKDISGQKLIDESIVLLNDERIDLKLQ